MKIAENVFQLECAQRSHVFLVAGSENIRIDTCLPGYAKPILI